MSIFFVDGKFVDAAEAMISVQDLAVLRGYGAFDFLRTYNRQPFYLKEHIERLANSAKEIGLVTKWSNQEIEESVMKTLDKNPELQEANIRILITGGESLDGLVPDGNGKLIVMVTPPKKNPANWYTDGVKIITTSTERFLPDAKSINYLAGVMALQAAKQANAIEAIYVNKNNMLLEGTTTNFFCFIDGKLVTVGKNVLSGITRKVIAELAADHFEIEIRDVNIGEIPKMDEVFISASNKEIVPVIQIDDHIIADGKLGPNTQKIMSLFRVFTTNYFKTQ